MKLYIFRCRTRPKMYGATRFETASNLPTDRCSGVWEFYELVELTQRGTLRFAVDTGTLRSQVQRNGWYVWDESPPGTPRAVPVETKAPRREAERPVAVPLYDAPEVVPDFRQAMAPPTTADVIPARHGTTAATIESRAPRPFQATSAQHQVVWFDIPVRDIDRAVRFYSAVLGIQLKKEQAGPGMAMAELPHAEGSIAGCLVQNMDARPSETGPLLYLNAHGRLNEALIAVEVYGGRVLSPKHSISPFGFRAIVLDSEGNRVALHSM